MCLLDQGNQLRRDLNVIVATGKNWRIPVFWAPLLKYVTSPVLVIVMSLAYPDFVSSGSRDPLHIVGFTLSHLVLATAIIGYIAPRWFDALILPSRRHEGDAPTVVNMESSVVDALADRNMESQEASVEAEERKEDKIEQERDL